MAEKAILRRTTEGTVPRQSSVLFSLKELMRIEERRVEEERRAGAARSEALERARRDASARALAEEAERLRLSGEEQKAELMKPKSTPPPTPLPPSATAVQPLAQHLPVVKPRKVCPTSLDPLDDCL